MLGLLGIKGILTALAVVAMIGSAVAGWNYLIENPRIYKEAYTAGENRERAEWQIRMTVLQNEMDEQRRQSQTRINTIEREYANERRRSQAELASLEQAIAEMEAEMENDEDASGVQCPCRPALPRSLSNRLNQIGR